MAKVVVVGAGAMGCLFAARLALGGQDVTVVDVSADRLDLIGREGIHLHDDAGHHVAKVRAAFAADVAGAVDLVILMTKGMHSAAAIGSVAHLDDGCCLVLTLQNGLGNVEAIADVFEKARILWGVTDFPADLEGPNAVASHGQGHIWLGGVNAAAHAHADAVVAWLNAGDLNAAADAKVQSAVWEKVAFNAALNALSTITGLPVGGLDCAEGRRIAEQVLDETIATAAALGITVDRARLKAKIDFALANHRTHKPSMLQDRLAGRPTEIESINGAIEKFAAQAGVEVPTTRLLADLVRMAEPRS
ncbi:MAG: 2-dehydropantoate 2-reductase [Novosphingobium sp. 17-62-19]|uniref:ketopantoate reductase family protein n=1 Tax=Novosphingobium sp. 17-62-19 TaxID=1970406 RepID=UPI000BDB8C9F|nr:2-dehydropantoate 2-reductase [Novosphingobium sp. 17-62-19]OYX96290.1 MAG: 2-dehydropantoate 2-reductase [Novosphingobium sp. 35-62-5]OZA17082.1 MAG: 2-dehydropantoate 2-reductase [Novosphingobium sp. 17-62-19]HQS97517.1 2-dehydropantoate 2-reductase [Novosphingobium sp.]